MKGKRHRKYAGSRIISSLRVSVRLAALCLLVSFALMAGGCGKTEESSIDTATQPAAAAPAAAKRTEPAEPEKTSAATDESSGAESEAEGEKTASSKSSEGKTESKTAKTTKKSTSQSGGAASQQTETQKAPDSTAQKQETPAQTGGNEQPANATVTSKVTSASSKETSQKTETSKPAETPAQEYHIYADGYVTKYDELKIKNLSKAERSAYDALSEGIWKMQRDIKIPSGVIKQKDAADFLNIVLNTMPEVNYLTGTFRISVSGGYVKRYTIDYTLSKDEASSEHKKLRSAASKIVGGLDSSMSDYEKVKYFHDYIVKNCEYDTQSAEEGHGSSYTAYGCLVEGKAVCEGYALAMDYLCEKAGIYSLLISGESTNSSGQTLSHIWNKIQLDGKWYNFDVTWDDPVSSFGSDYVRYDYFGVTDEELALTHKVQKNSFGYYPDAAETDANYFRKNGIFIEDAGQAEDIMIHAFELALCVNEKTISVRCADDETYSEVIRQILSSDEATGIHMVYKYLRAAGASLGKEVSYSGYYLVKNEKLDILAIVIK